MSSPPEEATLLFNDGINLFMEDARLGLKYIMLRLEDELTKEDRANLRDLNAIGFAIGRDDCGHRAERPEQEGGRSRCHLWSARSASHGGWITRRRHKNQEVH